MVDGAEPDEVDEFFSRNFLLMLTALNRFCWGVGAVVELVPPSCTKVGLPVLVLTGIYPSAPVLFAAFSRSPTSSASEIAPEEETGAEGVAAGESMEVELG